MADIDYSFPANTIDTTKTLSALSNLRLNDAHADLYTLQAAQAKRRVEGLVDMPAAVQGDQDALGRLSQRSPEDAVQAGTIRKGMLESSATDLQNQRVAIGRAAQGLLQLTDPAQRDAAFDAQMQILEQSRAVKPEQAAQIRKMYAQNPVGTLNFVIHQTLSGAETPSVAGATEGSKRAAALPSELIQNRDRASYEPPVSIQERDNTSPTGYRTRSYNRAQQPGAGAGLPGALDLPTGPATAVAPQPGAPSGGSYGVGPVLQPRAAAEPLPLSPATAQGSDQGIPVKAYAQRVSQRIENPNGNPAARNPNSTATGDGQFTENTWLDQIQKNRPDLVQGRSRADLLALRANPQLAEQMVSAYATENAQILDSHDIPVNTATLAMAHQGPARAVRILTAAAEDPNTPMGRLLDANDLRNNGIPPNMPAAVYARTFVNKVGADPVQGLTRSSAPGGPGEAGPAEAPGGPPPVPAPNGAGGPITPVTPDARAAVAAQPAQAGPGGPQVQPIPAQGVQNVRPPPPGGVLTPPPAAAPAAPLPSTMAPASTSRGIPGMPVMTDEQKEDVKRTEAAIQPQIKNDSEAVAKLQDEVRGRLKMLSDARLIKDYADSITTGWGAESKLQGTRILKGLYTVLGYTPAEADKDMKAWADLPDVGGAQVAQKMFLSLSMGAAREMGAREPGSVLAMFRDAYPGLQTDPKAVRIMTNAITMELVRKAHMADAMEAYFAKNRDDWTGSNPLAKVPYQGIRGFDKLYAQTNPPDLYMKAAEAMSGEYDKIKDMKPDEFRQVVSLIPAGEHFISPEGPKAWHRQPARQPG